MTAAPYSVFEGFSDLFEDFESWLGKSDRQRGCMAICLRPTGVEFAGGEDDL